MAGYASARALAERLIAKKGRRDGVLRRPSSDNAAPAGRPWAPADADPAQDPAMATDLSVVVLDAKLFKKDELTPETSAVAYLAASACPEPRSGDVLETRGSRHSVIGVEDLAPGEDSILYTLHLKA
jgi:hypothetical protein